VSNKLPDVNACPATTQRCFKTTVATHNSTSEVSFKLGNQEHESENLVTTVCYSLSHLEMLRSLKLE